jgi:hypothetical protein
MKDVVERSYLQLQGIINDLAFQRGREGILVVNLRGWRGVTMVPWIGNIPAELLYSA